MITITKEFLKKNDVCEEGLEWWIENCDGLPLFEQLDKIKNYNKGWAAWVIPRLLCEIDKALCIKFAVFAAQLVLPIFEKEFPGDERPRIAIEVANKYVKNPTDIVTAALDAARAAETAARAAAETAARAAETAARAAAMDDIRAAEDAARTATWAASRAAWAAACAAGDAADATLSKIIDYGVGLLKKEIKK